MGNRRPREMAATVVDEKAKAPRDGRHRIRLTAHSAALLLARSSTVHDIFRLGEAKNPANAVLMAASQDRFIVPNIPKSSLAIHIQNP
jgi:hypothetical protein